MKRKQKNVALCIVLSMTACTDYRIPIHQPPMASHGKTATADNVTPSIDIAKVVDLIEKNQSAMKVNTKELNEIKKLIGKHKNDKQIQSLSSRLASLEGQLVRQNKVFNESIKTLQKTIEAQHNEEFSDYYTDLVAIGMRYQVQEGDTAGSIAEQFIRLIPHNERLNYLSLYNPTIDINNLTPGVWINTPSPAYIQLAATVLHTNERIDTWPERYDDSALRTEIDVLANKFEALPRQYDDSIIRAELAALTEKLDAVAVRYDDTQIMERLAKLENEMPQSYDDTELRQLIRQALNETSYPRKELDSNEISPLEIAEPSQIVAIDETQFRSDDAWLFSLEKNSYVLQVFTVADQETVKKYATEKDAKQFKTNVNGTDYYFLLDDINNYDAWVEEGYEPQRKRVEDLHKKRCERNKIDHCAQHISS